MKTGALILASGKGKRGGTFWPLTEAGGISVIRRMVITLKASGISTIVAVTGERSSAVEREVARLGVICLKNDSYLESYMFDNVCMGIRYMEPFCDRIFILPAKYPALLPHTLELMLRETSCCVCPVYQGRRSHPVLLCRDIYPDILSYQGPSGLRGALAQPKIAGCTALIPVTDAGVVLTVHDIRQNHWFPETELPLPVYPSAEFTLNRNGTIFSADTARFLALIDHTGSIRTACSQMSFSYSKGWNMIRALEKQLGFPVLHTQTGGASGGSSRLTKEAHTFLRHFTAAQEKLSAYAAELFTTFQDGGSL